jgi:PAS domain S-box-containing protein
MDQPKRRLRSRQPLIEWLLLGLALTVLGSFIAYSLFHEYKRIDAQERERLVSQVRIVDENLIRQLQAVSSTLAGIRDDVPDLHARADGKRVMQRRLQAMCDAIPGVRTMNIVDATGTIVVSSRDQLTGLNLRERGYFEIPHQHPDPAALYVSQPFETVLGVFVIALARVMVDARGDFAGTITATLDPDYFRTLLISVRYAPDMFAALVHGDGKIFLTVPEREGILGQDLARQGSFFMRHLESGESSTVLTGRTLVSGEERMLAQHTVQPDGLHMSKPLIVSVGRDPSRAFDRWRRDVYTEGAVFGLLVLVTGLSLYFYRKRRHAYERLAESHASERRRSAEWHRALLQTAMDGFWLADMQGRLLEVNETYCRMSGYGERELLAMRIADLEAVESDGQTAAHIRKVMARGEDRFRSRHRRKDGSIFDVEVSVQYRPVEDGRLVVFLQDITERARTDNTLKLHSEILLHVGEGVQITRIEDQTIVYSTPAFDRMFGYSAGELAGKHVSTLNAAGNADPETVAREINEILDRTGSWSGELENMKKDGTPFWCWVNISTFEHYEWGKVWVAVHEDITKRKDAEAEVRLAREAAHRDLLVREVHHRIKNNLQGITGVLRQFAERHRETMEPINQAISQVQSIAAIHGLQGRSALARVRVCELTQSIAREVESIWGCPVMVDIPPDWVPCRVAEAEAVPLALVLNELISNAVKHGDQPGQVRIVLRRPSRSAAIRLSIYNAGRLPPGFDVEQRTPTSTGLQLVASLLPRAGIRLSWQQQDHAVVTLLEIESPVIAFEPNALLAEPGAAP